MAGPGGFTVIPSSIEPIGDQLQAQTNLADSIGKFLWDPNTPPSWEDGPQPNVPAVLQPVRDFFGGVEDTANAVAGAPSAVSDATNALLSQAAPYLLAAGLLWVAVEVRRAR